MSMADQDDPKYNLKQLRGAFGAGNKAKPTIGNAKGIEGLFFLSFHADGFVQWQGRVMRHVTGDRILVQLYEWLVGGPWDVKLVAAQTAEAWTFFWDEEDWAYAAKMAMDRDQSRRAEVV